MYLTRITYIVVLSLTVVFQAQGIDSPKPLEHIAVQLRYVHQFQFAGFYAAIKQGYYKDAGLEVTLIEADLGKKTVDEVLSGNAQYGQTQTDLLYYRLQGQPLVALAAIFQHSPTVLMVRADSDIYSPHDLIGKRVMLEMGDNAISTLAMLQNEGVELSDIEVVKQSYGINELVSGSVDAIGVYITNRPYLLNKAGIDYRILNPINYGIDFYGDTIFTTENEIKENPERVARFLEATLKGWQYAMDHPNEIIELLINQYDVKKSRGHLEYEAKTMETLLLPELIEVGHMNPGRWQRMAEIFVNQDKSTPNYSLENFIYVADKPWYTQYWIRYFFITLVLLFLATISFLYYWRLSTRLKKVIVQRNLAEKNNLRLGHVLEQSSNEIYIFDVNTLLFKQVNYGGRKNLGYDMEELQKLTPLDVKPEYSQATFTELVEPLKTKAQSQIVFETVHKRKDNSLYPVEVRLQMFNDHEQPVFYAIINDITDRKKINQELKEKNTELEQFIYMISHDLKSPLVTVKTFLDYLQQDVRQADQERIDQDIGFMKSATNKMGTLLEDLLEFSRIGRKSITPVSVSFNKIIKDVLSITAGMISEKKVKINVDNTDLMLLGDHSQLIQIWQNLVENAIKYMGNQSKPQIDIGIQFQDNEPVFFVRDYGIGIDPRYQDKIFELFEQLDANVEGSGLGLALVKRLVNSYHGNIRVESKGLNQGACFFFTLPLAINKLAEIQNESQSS